MTCPSCKREPCADGRARCWGCLETELDAVKVTCEGRAKVTTYIPYDGADSSPYKTRMRRQSYRCNRKYGA